MKKRIANTFYFLAAKLNPALKKENMVEKALIEILSKAESLNTAREVRHIIKERLLKD